MAGNDDVLAQLAERLERIVRHVKYEAQTVRQACDKYEAVIATKENEAWLARREQELRERSEKRMAEEEALALLERAESIRSKSATEGEEENSKKVQAFQRASTEKKKARLPPVPREAVRKAARASAQRKGRKKLGQDKAANQDDGEQTQGVDLSFEAPPRPAEYARLRARVVRQSQKLSASRKRFLATVLPRLSRAGIGGTEPPFGAGLSEEDSLLAIDTEAQAITSLLESTYPPDKEQLSFEAAAALENKKNPSDRALSTVAIARAVLETTFPQWFIANVVKERITQLEHSKQVLRDICTLVPVGVAEYSIHTRVARRKLIAAAKKAYKARQRLPHTYAEDKVTGPLKRELRSMVQRELFATLQPHLQEWVASEPVSRDMLAVLRLLLTAHASPMMMKERVAFVDLASCDACD
mmetsp:Transcript_6571/g.12131  ORF Transcript_6571/g.12131 Transcript_6571/m.12131 type:complete len:415 (-) Transcript_6571:23-1267(-)